MSKQRRRLVFHVGTPKTGSTALQQYLVRNRNALRERGIVYPEHRSDKRALNGLPMGGNGVDLQRSFRSKNPDDVSVIDALNFLTDEVERGDAGDLLFSSEALWNFPQDATGIRHIVDGMGRMDVDVLFVVFVRDIAEHAISSYSQHVRRHLYSGTFGDFIGRTSDGGAPRRYFPVDLRKLDLLADAVGQQNVVCLHYNDVRSNIVAEFLAQIFNVRAPEDSAASTVVNRSLTQDEIELMRRLNEKISDVSAAARISDALSEVGPLGERRLAATDKDVEHLERDWAQVVAHVNRTYLAEATTPLAIRDRTAHYAPADYDVQFPPELEFAISWLGAIFRDHRS